MVNDIHDWLTVVNPDSTSPNNRSDTVAVGNTGRTRLDKNEPRGIDPSISDRFRPICELGSGGMSSVHESEDLRLLRRTALKVMHPDLVNDATLRHQFIIEAQVTAQLEHPNIVPVYEFGEDARDVPYLNIRKVSGRTLHSTIQAGHDERLNRANLKSVVRILLNICDALGYAHSRGVVHCDVKPSNIMVGEFGEAYLMDWGIALTGIGPHDPNPVRISDTLRDPRMEGPIYLGSPAYMAPEQATGNLSDVDQRTDIFLLGATLYHLLAGQAPYQDGRTSKDSMRLAERVAYPTVQSCLPGHRAPASLVRVVEQALARNPDDRFQCIDEIRRELRVFLEGKDDLEIERYAPGSTIVEEGEPGDRAFIITSGRCEVYTWKDGERRVLRELGAGEVFGEMAILSGGVRIASVDAVTDVELETVTKNALSEGLGVNTGIGKFITTLADRFKDVDRRARDADV